MARTAMPTLATARNALAAVGLLALILGLLGMHVWAGGHQISAAGAPMTHTAASATPATAMHAMHAVSPAAVLAKSSNAGEHMSMTGACTLDRPQLSADGTVDLPSTVAPARAIDSRTVALPRSRPPGADPPSLNGLGISRT